MTVDGYFGCNCDKYNPDCRCHPKGDTMSGDVLRHLVRLSGRRMRDRAIRWERPNDGGDTMSGGEFCLNCGTMIGDGSGHYTPCDCPGWEHTMIDTDTRATDGAAKIRKILNDIRGDELKRGTVVRASTTLRTCPSDMNRIEHHLNALAAQLAEAEARNHRLATALEREVNRTRRMQTRIPMTAAQIEEYHHLQPGDLDTSGEGTS